MAEDEGVSAIKSRKQSGSDLKYIARMMLVRTQGPGCWSLDISAQPKKSHWEG